MTVLRSLALSLLLTLALELPAALLFGLRKKEELLLVGLVNVITNPLVVLALNLFALFAGIAPPWFLILPLEVFAILTEGLIYRRGLSKCPVHPLVFSLILNGISYTGGLLLS